MNQSTTPHTDILPTFLPRLCVTALSGGGGKTLLSLGLCRSFALRGVTVQPFKKGPDYIDAAWLRLAAGLPASNLDPYFLEAPRLRALFVHTMRTAASQTNGCGCGNLSAAQPRRLLGLLEGNRGFFDGMDARGSCSTAELSRILSCPVIISVDCTKMTRTAAALVRGMLTFEPGITFAGVVLNQVGSARHERILRQALEEHTDVPVLGALPRLAENPLPERHMGIASCGDDLSPQAQQVLDTLATFVSGHVDMDRILAAAESAPELEADPFWPEATEEVSPNASVGQRGCADAATLETYEKITDLGGPESIKERKPRIGYVRDAALWFYYEENFEALRRAGADLVRLSLLEGPDGEHKDSGWPQLDGLYLGGGFPEDHVEALSGSPLLRQFSQWAGQGMPIYAECGGFMVLSRGIERQGKLWPMGGILPVTAVFCPKPQGLGYVRGSIADVNPFFPLQTELRGHEFHYSRCRWEETADHPADATTEPLALSAAAQSRRPSLRWAMKLHKGQGMGLPPESEKQNTASASDPQKVDGLVFRNVWASYTHIFAPAAPGWAENFVAAARDFAAHDRSASHE